MGDLPLRTPTDRCLGGPLPRRQANQTHPHPIAVNLCFTSDALYEEHRVLIRFSPGYALLRGRLDTRYSPVRRSPASIASYRSAAPRLACVKPVASVHPEPGSNSSLYNLYLCQYHRGNAAAYWTLSVPERLSNSVSSLMHLNLFIDRRFVSSYPNARKSIRFLYYFCLCKSFKELFNAFSLDFFHDSEIQVNLYFARCLRSSFCASQECFPV